MKCHFLWWNPMACDSPYRWTWAISRFSRTCFLDTDPEIAGSDDLATGCNMDGLCWQTKRPHIIWHFQICKMIPRPRSFYDQLREWLLFRHHRAGKIFCSLLWMLHVTVEAVFFWPLSALPLAWTNTERLGELFFLRSCTRGEITGLCNHLGMGIQVFWKNTRRPRVFRRSDTNRLTTRMALLYFGSTASRHVGPTFLRFSSGHFLVLILSLFCCQEIPVRWEHSGSAQCIAAYSARWYLLGSCLFQGKKLTISNNSVSFSLGNFGEKNFCQPCACEETKSAPRGQWRKQHVQLPSFWCPKRPGCLRKRLSVWWQ